MTMNGPHHQSETYRGTILIVDDTQSNLRLLERLLERDHHRLIAAASGEEALAAVRRYRPDLIIMDVLMPGLNGIDTCRILKNDPETRLIPIVLVTALQNREDRVRGIDAGADDFISRPINLPELTARVRSLLRLKRFTDELDSAESVILSLGMTIETRDGTTEGHCHRLANYAVLVGEAVGLDHDALHALRKGGFLHDVGKVGIPDAVLLKQSRLTADEMRIMQQHTVIGERLCGSLRSLHAVRPIVRHHHERLDGSGYPDGLKGTAVPLLAQITSVVDVFDALTTARPYKIAMSVERACEELDAEAKKGWRDPVLVAVTIRLARAGWAHGPSERSLSRTG